MSKAGKMHGEIVSEEEVAKGLGFANVDEFRRWQTELGHKKGELEFALSEAKRESRRFRWAGMRMEFMLGKAEAYLQTELNAAKHHVAKLENSGVMAEGAMNENSEMAAVKDTIEILEKLLLGIRVVCNRDVDWKHVLEDWLGQFNKSDEEIFKAKQAAEAQPESGS
jgi:hypothetical protein